jgi:uncharacterized protein with von Willebrand factor type A (vWA) domain
LALGNALQDKLADNVFGFCRTLRRAGLPVDSRRIALAQQALRLVDIGERHQVCAALEAVLVSRPEDRPVFYELFDAVFRNPEMAKQLMAQLLPSNKAADQTKRRPRSQEALRSPAHAPPQSANKQEHPSFELDMTMSMSETDRLRKADFEQLSAAEAQKVQQLACRIPLCLPRYKSRRQAGSLHGRQTDWRETMRRTHRSFGEMLRLGYQEPVFRPMPLVILVDISGSMERYARMVLSFLHAATHLTKPKVFAFGSRLTNLSQVFRQPDTDLMLLQAADIIPDYAGGTRMAESLQDLRKNHRGAFIGRRSLVLVITDGLDTGEPNHLHEGLRWLQSVSGRLLWLNPLMRYSGYQPLAAGASTLARFSDSRMAVYNLESLEVFAKAIEQLLGRSQVCK